MTDIEITKSSGNVFADLGFPDADTHLVKAKLVSNILDTMRDQGLTQTKTAELMGITQPEISRFSNGRRQRGGPLGRQPTHNKAVA